MNNFMARVSFGTIFKILYLLLTLLSFNSLTAHTQELQYYAYLIAVFGAGVLIYRLIHYKRYIPTKNIVLLAMFCASFLISVVANRKYGFVENIQAFAWLVFMFFLLYMYDTTREPGYYKKEFMQISMVYLVYTAICVTVALIMLATRYSSARSYGKNEYVLCGFLWGRLWGIYTDPNYGAVFSVLSILLSLYFLQYWKNSLLKVLLSLNMVMQFLYIPFSDSRTGLLCLTISLSVYSALFFLKRQKEKYSKIWARRLLSVLLIFAVGVGLYGADIGIKKAYNSYVVSSAKTSQTSGKEAEITKLVGRQKDLQADISNRRVAIWGSAVEIFLTKPVTGVSFRGIVPYALENAQKTYIVNNSQGNFASMHNIFMDVLVSQGLIGVTLFVAFFVVTLMRVYRVVKQVDEKNDCVYIITVFCILLAIGLSSLVYSEVLYINTSGSVIFWCFLGYLIHYSRSFAKGRGDDGKVVAGGEKASSEEAL